MFKTTFLLIMVLFLTSCQVKKGGAAGGILAPPTNNYTTTISGTTNEIADNSDFSVITITVMEAGVPVVGNVPTFTASGSGNFIAPCLATDATGTSICTLKSTKAETKTIAVVSPKASTATSITFIAGSATAANSTITSSGPSVADGVANNNILLTLKDAFGNPVAGTIPAFNATDPGNTNVYGSCSVTNTSGLSNCTMKSLRAGIKTLQITSPVTVSGGPAFFWSGPAVAANSFISGTSPHNADGVDASAITVNFFDANMNPVAGVIPTFTATGSNNVSGACSTSSVAGISNCTLKTTAAGVKTISLATPFVKAGNAITFNGVVGAPSVANSSITASSPHVANGVDASTVTITLKDGSNNAVPGIVPTFLATDTNATNSYAACSATDASGVSTCLLTSTFAETKNLMLTTPIVKAGGTTTFVPGVPSSVTSTIAGTTPVTADGIASSTISIYIADAFNNPIAGETPTFSATDTGFQNIYGACSVTAANGQSSCTLKSSFAETKTLMLLTPVAVTGGNVVFVASAAVAANSNITGTGPVIADGTATSTVTITLRDINNNPVAAQTPTFSATDTGTTNTYGICSATDASGVSTCTLKSTTAETKTLSIATPVIKADGTVIFTPAGPSVANSSITGSSPVVADGVATSTITVTLKDSGNNPVSGVTPTFSATDTGTTNTYGVCSATDGSGISLCTLSSTKAETKTLSITGPITKPDGSVIFIPGTVAAATSVISGTTPVVADGVATSTVTITLLDSFSNPVSAQVPTFSATDTGTTNVYGICPASDASGVSTCTLASTKAETKTLSIVTPVVKAGSNVVFTAGTPVAANSHITGTTPVVADGISTSIITVTLNDVNNNPVVGSLPVFSATDSGSTNSYGVCSLSDASGTSSCTLSSTFAETKTLSLVSPLIDTGDSVVFTAAGASVANSTISGTTPVVADGVATSTVTITLKDSNNNSVVGTTPTFSATDTGSTNSYGICSATNSSGISTCTLASTKAEGKTLSIATPIIKSGSIVNFIAGSPVAANSGITGSGPVVADGVATSTVTINLKDINNNPVSGQTPTFSATDSGTNNSYGVCSSTNASGDATCTLSSVTAEVKTLSIVTPVAKADGSVTFTAGSAVAANSTIIGTTPVVADGVATSTVTITLKDINNNDVAGVTPTFSATDTGSGNNFGACSPTTTYGISTCTLSSTVAEVKTLSIATPVVKTGNNVTFTPGGPSIANSSITGTTPVVANGTSTSTVTIIIKDASNNAISGTVPTFSATDTGSTNSYGVCSATDASGISTCTLSSTKAEVKTLTLTSPVNKAGSNITFVPDSPFAATSTITGTSPILADGTATSAVTITILDANTNPISGQTPTFTATNTGSGNNYGTCSVTDAAGVSTCTLSSTVAEVKTLSIATPVVKADGTVTFTAGSAVAANSTITGTSPVLADGTATSTVTITLKDASNNPVPGETPTFSATDTGSGNNYGACSASDASGISTCTLNSTYAEVKTLSIATPFVKAGGTVTFTPGSPVAANSTITGTTPVVADGSATSTITITLKDTNNNAVPGQTPTFSATDTGATNVYNTCSASDVSGVSTCTLTSLKAETKTLSIATPFVKAGSNVVFIAGAPVAANSSIIGTSPVVADGSSTSTITITLMDVNNNPVAGQTPTFTATDTGSTNANGACSASNASGVSTCALSSSYAEVKTLSIATPVVKAGGTVTFTAGSAVAANSTITGTSPVVADGTATSTVTITLKDATNNPVSGIVPTFGATDTGTTNVYGTCPATDVSGVSSCTLTSTKAEVKTLSIATPVVKAGGTVTFTAGAAVAANSTITGTSPVVADGTATSTVTITLLDASSNPVAGQTPTFSATDTGTTNVYTACSSSNASGVSTCTLKSTKAEVKTLSIATPVVKAGGTVTFNAGVAVAANSTITGTSPVVADGTATSTITITLLDAFSNPVSGQTPTFTATNTGSSNANGACSVSNASGVSTCTLASANAEVKTLSIATPVVKAGGTVTFTAGSAVAANSTISGTGPVLANGIATSTVTILLKDAANNPVTGITPTFSATDTGAGNTYQACSASDATGTSTCTMRSTKSEVKTLSIATPVVKAGTTVTFTAGTAVAANSTITGTGPVVADGTATSTVTVNLKDVNSNNVPGITPVFTSTGTGNTIGACGATDAAGLATCTLRSTRAQIKTLSISSPFAKTGGTVTFIAGSPSAVTTTITGTTPVSADGVSTSFISITILDANSNAISGTTPIFNATDTNTTNVYGACGVSDVNGLSMCTLASTKAEFKTLQLTSPVAVTGDVIEFSSSLPTSANSTITGTGPVLADGSADSTITITLKDGNNNAVAGIVPDFDATNTAGGNAYDTCSMSDAGGVSVCTMQSTVAEVKALRITAPVTKTGGNVTFTAGAVAASTSTITGSGPVIADGAATSTITITLKDINGNNVAGQTPTFTATNTGSTNVNGACSATNSSGISTCTLSSTKAEIKTLAIATPVSKTGGNVTFTAGTAVAATSTITGTGPTNPDGISQSTITITLKDANNNFVSGIVPTFTASGTNNTYNTCSSTNASGVSTCTMTSTTPETKTLSIATPFIKADGTVVFASGSPSIANSSITATGPVIANGVATSTVTITLKDNTNAAVINVTPTFSADGSNNTYGACSVSNGSGISTCTMTSTRAEDKTVSIATPIVKAGNIITFTPGPPSASTSTIACDTTVYKASTDSCDITVTILDAFNNAISGVTPTISVSGTLNTVSACSATDAFGASACTLSTTKAEGKFLSIVTPVSVANPTEYEFNPDGTDLQVPIEMADRGLASNTTAITFARTRTSIDPADYVADTNDYFFEVSAANTNTTTGATVQLVNGANAVIADSLITVPANTTATTRYRVQFTPSAGLDTYRVRVSGTATASQLRVHSARIIIEQTNAVKTKLWIPLVGGDFAGETNSDTGGTVATTTGTAYTVSSALYYYTFTRADANYDAIPATASWTLDVVMRSSTTTGTASAALFNRTTGLQVAEVTNVGNTTVNQRMVTFNSNATNFVNANDYELRIKSSISTTTAQVMKAGLWVKLKYLKKADVWWRLATRRSTTTTVALPDARFWYESAVWSNPVIRFSTIGLTTTTAIQLFNTGTADNIITGTSVSSLTQPAAQARTTSAPLTLVDNDRYIINHQRTSGTAAMAGAFLQINVDD